MECDGLLEACLKQSPIGEFSIPFVNQNSTEVISFKETQQLIAQR